MFKKINHFLSQGNIPELPGLGQIKPAIFIHGDKTRPLPLLNKRLQKYLQIDIKLFCQPAKINRSFFHIADKFHEKRIIFSKKHGSGNGFFTLFDKIIILLETTFLEEIMTVQPAPGPAAKWYTGGPKPGK